MSACRRELAEKSAYTQVFPGQDVTCFKSVTCDRRVVELLNGRLEQSAQLSLRTRPSHSHEFHHTATGLPTSAV